MQEVKVDLNFKTVEDVVEQRTESYMTKKEIAKAVQQDVSKCSKAIHAMGGEGWVWEQLTQGVTVTSLCQGLGVSVDSFNRWVRRGGEARQAALSRARADAAHTLVDESLAIADETQYAESNVQVQAAKLRADMRWKVAAAWNKAEYGQQQAQVQVNIGDLALDALRKRTVVIDADDVTDNDR
jgi:hypothetical protein